MLFCSDTCDLHPREDKSIASDVGRLNIKTFIHLIWKTTKFYYFGITDLDDGFAAAFGTELTEAKCFVMG